jgi:hypothetical protein
MPAAPTPATVPPSPVRLVGHLDPGVSRWMWLVKWLLLIPHLLVLSLLLPVFVVTTLVAGVAILVTGRYPRGLFDLNVGILRWGWRVTFYGYGVLGTDRYPPFSLSPSTGQPVDLAIAYPARLSRPLVLVKWLLALPHWIILAVFTGGGLSWTFASETGVRVTLGGGVVGLLVLVVGLILLFTGRYPPALFGLLLGMHRWSFRVVAYAALMTDQYPPFRLDQGPDEPGVATVGPPA